MDIINIAYLMMGAGLGLLPFAIYLIKKGKEDKIDKIIKSQLEPFFIDNTIIKSILNRVGGEND